MATDLIELEVVVRDKTLKQSLTTVSRLEREITKAAKAVDANTMSQQRYNQVLLSAKRQYEALGVSSQKATAAVRQYAAQVRAASAATNTMGGSVDAMGKRLNRTGVLTQQAGYQVGDFLVQVQSGTNIMVAFGQQATQMVGTFAMLAKSTKAIAMFSALGIAIPIITAVGAALMRTRDSAKEFEDATFDINEAAKNSAEELAKYREEVALLTSEFETLGEVGLDRQIKSLTNEIKDLEGRTSAIRSAALLGFGAAGGITSGADLQKQIDESISAQTSELQRQILIKRQQLAQLVMERESVERVRELTSDTNALLDAGRKATLDRNRVNRQTILDLEQEISLLRTIQQYGEDSKEAVIQRARQEGISLNLTEENLQKYIDLTVQAWEIEKAIASSADATKALAEAGKEAAAAFAAISGFGVDLEGKIAVARAQLDALNNDQNAQIAGEIASLRVKNDLLLNDPSLTGEALEAANQEYNKNLELIGTYEQLQTAIQNQKDAQTSSTSASKDAERAAEQLRREQEKLRKELEAPMVNAIDGVANAWGDFVARGFKDFKGFVNSVLGSFQNMIAQMIAMAARNKIMLSLGLGGSVAGGAASAATSGALGGVTGAIGGAFGTAATGLYTGAVGAFNGLAAGGGLAGMATNIGGLVSGGVAAGGVGGIATAIGAVAGPLLAVAAVFSFFKKKTKELDSGIRGNVEGYDSLIESFQKIQTSRFFGLSKKTSTNATAMADDNPISQAITSVQMSVLQTAEYLGIATDALNDFSYDFNVSLKGLSEEAKAQKIAEEVQKLGDAFAALLPNIQSLEQLTAIMNERYSLETRLLQVQGDTQALRDRELAATNEYNREILQQIYAAEDAAAATQQLNQALNALSENNFATLLDFNRAKAAMRMGEPVANIVGAPASPVSAVSPAANPAGATVAELRTMRAEMKEQHEEVMFAYSKITKNGKDTRDTLRSWDVVGLPAERTA